MTSKRKGRKAHPKENLRTLDGAMARANLSERARNVGRVLAHWVGTDGVGWPSLDTIAKTVFPTGVRAREEKIREALTELTKSNLVFLIEEDGSQFPAPRDIVVQIVNTFGELEKVTLKRGDPMPDVRCLFFVPLAAPARTRCDGLRWAEGHIERFGLRVKGANWREWLRSQATQNDVGNAECGGLSASESVGDVAR